MPTITSENFTSFTKKQLQDFNVSHGLARCDNESKSKTLAKTKSILFPMKCSIQIDSDSPVSFSFPPGKSKQDLVFLIQSFFNTPSISLNAP